MATMTIGEFSARTRLSPKALRLYDRLGLLTPVGVDPVNGYRRYAEEQVDDAVLVGLLRRLDMPLQVIATVLAADTDARSSLVRSYWDGVERVSAERRSLVAYLCSRLEGTTMSTHDVLLRTMPQRHVVSITRHVFAPDAGAFFDEAFATLRATGPGLAGIAGCPFLVCELAWPAMRTALDDLEAWARANDRRPAATFRQVLIADQRTASDDTLVCDLSVPLR